MTFDHSKPLSNHLRRKGNNESVYSRLQSQPCTEEVLLAEGHLLQGGGAHTVGGMEVGFGPEGEEALFICSSAATIILVCCSS